jgi:hypothetical protein
MDNNGEVQNASYSAERLESLKKIVEQRYEPNISKGKRYCILVDNEIVVGTTTDPAKFDDYFDFVEPHTRSVEVRLFFGTSPNHNKHIFRCTPNNGLSGIEQHSKIEEERQRWKLEQDLGSYKRKARKYKRRLAKATSMLEEANTENEELQGNNDIKNIVVQALSFMRSGKKSDDDSPLHGSPNQPQSEVEIEGITQESEVSDAALRFDALMSEYEVTNPKGVLKMMEVLIKRPDIQKVVFEMIKKK